MIFDNNTVSIKTLSTMTLSIPIRKYDTYHNNIQRRNKAMQHLANWYFSDSHCYSRVCRCAECHNQVHFDKCCYAECRHAECRGAFITSSSGTNLLKPFFYYLANISWKQACARLKICPLPFRSHIVHFWFNFFHSVHILFCYGLIFSVQVKNGQD
jgi:hypothetical protein